jgi:hypothetical protein
MDFVVGSDAYRESMYRDRDRDYREIEYTPMGYEGYAGIYARGSRVRALQDWLNRNIHPSPPLKVDGLYGDNTRKWVKVLQKFLNATFRENLKVDGYYGCKTFNAVVSHYKQAGWTKPPLPIWGNCVSPAPVSVKKSGGKYHITSSSPVNIAHSGNNVHIAGFTFNKKMLLIGGGIMAIGLILLLARR